MLRTVEFSETSLIVTLLTRDLGRISALAKGARRIKGPFEGSLDLLSVCRIVLISKPGDRLDLLTESKLRRRFRGGQRSLERTYAGYHVAEILRTMIDDDDPHPELFDLTLATLDQIDGDGPVGASLLAFDCQCLRLLGHAPITDQCAGCGVKLESTGRWIGFSFEASGLVCEACRSRQASLLSLSWPGVGVLRDLLASPQSEATVGEGSEGFSIGSLLPRIDERSYATLRNLVSRYQQTLLGRPFRMQAFVPSRPD